MSVRAERHIDGFFRSLFGVLGRGLRSVAIKPHRLKPVPLKPVPLKLVPRGKRNTLACSNGLDWFDLPRTLCYIRNRHAEIFRRDAVFVSQPLHGLGNSQEAQ
jgi:hypothetical protein